MSSLIEDFEYSTIIAPGVFLEVLENANAVGISEGSQKLGFQNCETWFHTRFSFLHEPSYMSIYSYSVPEARAQESVNNREKGCCSYGSWEIRSRKREPGKLEDWRVEEDERRRLTLGYLNVS
jgi:hypothetical protein